MINVNNLKPGITYEEDGNLFLVLEAQHSKQGRGQATVKAKVKNMRTNSTIIKTYTGGSKVQSAHIVKKEMNFLYSDGTYLYFMDNKTYDQISLDQKNFEYEINFLVENQKVIVRFFNDEILDIELPAHVKMKVIDAPDAVKGNTQTNPQKKVKVSTEYELDVPMFIKEGEIIIVSTIDGKYIGRA